VSESPAHEIDSELASISTMIAALQRISLGLPQQWAEAVQNAIGSHGGLIAPDVVDGLRKSDLGDPEQAKVVAQWLGWATTYQGLLQRILQGALGAEAVERQPEFA
jgi:hypothetical protein